MDEEKLRQEIRYKAVRSSGAGGQNVNKVSSKVELHFPLDSTQVFTEEEKDRIREKLRSRLTNNNELVLQSDESRSQHRNKELVTKRFIEMVKAALVRQKSRKKTRPSKASKLKRLRSKKIQSEKKSNRKKPFE